MTCSFLARGANAINGKTHPISCCKYITNLWLRQTPLSSLNDIPLNKNDGIAFAFFVHNAVRDGQEQQIMSPELSLFEHFSRCTGLESLAKFKMSARLASGSFTCETLENPEMKYWQSLWLKSNS
jgi:hypothetical protein